MEFQIKSGSWRKVLILPTFGVAIKLPRIRISEAWNRLFYCITKPKTLYKELFYWNYEVHGTMKECLLKSVYQNWVEFYYSIRYRNPFTQTTYFSFFGLVNVQKLGVELEMDYVDLWYQLLDITNKEVWKDSHHFSATENFCVEDGHLKMFDYGSKGSREVVKKYGNLIYDKFDISYQREKKQG